MIHRYGMKSMLDTDYAWWKFCKSFYVFSRVCCVNCVIFVCKFTGVKVVNESTCALVAALTAAVDGANVLVAGIINGLDSLEEVLDGIPESIVFMEMYLCRFTPKRRFLFMGKIRREGKIINQLKHLKKCRNCTKHSRLTISGCQ